LRCIFSITHPEFVDTLKYKSDKYTQRFKSWFPHSSSGKTQRSMIENLSTWSVFDLASRSETITQIMEAVSTSETSVNHQTARRYNPEDSHFMEGSFRDN
jgi:ABC-type transport system involved in cytochrome c biogenesis ATPase subunit